MKPDSASILQEVRGLAALDLEGLRAAWRGRYGSPPKIRSVELLAHLLAWRIQSDALGGLDPATRRRIQSCARPRGPGVQFEPGTVLSREFRGELHQVIALEDGFRWRDRTFPNLSAVAFAISGAKRSGPLFFGLKGHDRG